MTPDPAPPAQDALIDRYIYLTKTVMPAKAKAERRDWPVVNDHCFQRIVLDHVCGDVWYNHIARPAYRNMTAAQTAKAIDLCEAIIAGRENLSAMNRQSLRWRGKLR
ncbi:MAG: hypothetical protein AAF718_04415 [Pseudomonadota bacterium]